MPTFQEIFKNGRHVQFSAKKVKTQNLCYLILRDISLKFSLSWVSKQYALPTYNCVIYQICCPVSDETLICIAQHSKTKVKMFPVNIDIFSEQHVRMITSYNFLVSK